MNIVGHFRTITKHRHLVIKHCFKAGIGLQGLKHDLSKYSPEEFFISCKYYTGKHSPIADERRDRGYSTVWMHHKGRNKHHYEYWVDMNLETKLYEPVPMPDRYVKEMICDRIAASKVYLGSDYDYTYPLKYYHNKEHGKMQIHPETQRKLVFVLKYLNEHGEEETFKYLRTHEVLDMCEADEL
ncbi:MAG: DUF5662 family protein [Lachnospiraceae bacterium]|nr:DUF5662 family protein [Lachnospiraceae bacterium]